MIDVESLTAKEVKDLTIRLRNRQHELERQEIEESKEAAKRNVGRCFRVNHELVKIVGIPQEEITMTGFSYNPYQYPAIHLAHRRDDFKRGFDPIPFYYGPQFSAAWGYGRDPLGTRYEEISNSEFVEEFNRRMDQFMLEYITGTIESAVRGDSSGG